jgi:hypothetical protein
LTGIGGPAPLLLLSSQDLSRSRNGTASSSSAGATAPDETASGDHTDEEGNQATFPLILRCLFQTYPLSETHPLIPPPRLLVLRGCSLVLDAIMMIRRGAPLMSTSRLCSLWRRTLYSWWRSLV